MSFFNKIFNLIKKIITGIKKVLTLNIGTLLFGALFIYLISTMFMYMTTERVTTYQVISGPLTKNETYTGIIVREEQLVQSGSPGYVTYYAREGSKVRKTGTVYAVGDTQEIIQNVELGEEDLSRIRSQIAKFSANFSSNNFSDTYSLKYELEGTVLASVDDVRNSESVAFGSKTLYNASADGIVIYSKDGYENKSAEDITADDFNKASYKEQDLITAKKIKTGDDVYKLITSEKWSVVIPLTDKQAKVLEDRTSIRVKFLKDGATQNGQISIMEKEGQKLAKLDFVNGMIRYASDRFVDIELVTNTKTGLKIPMSSVVTKEFYIIPESFMTQGDNRDEAGFLKQTKNKKGETRAEFITTALYELKDGYYYIDKSVFEEGDILIRSDSNEQFTVKDTATLEGVYNINKGYAVFRKVNIIDQNEEYCIVESNTAYGIAQFDNIVLNESSVKEEEIIY
ncbi:MAG: HlyD family efflux transporter periplasmic adaptor subunit [Lachnospiraceae bacterium]